MFCTACGRENEEGASFCSKCGRPIHENMTPVVDDHDVDGNPSMVHDAVSAIQSQMEIIYCTKCGRENPGSASRCVGCGNPFPGCDDGTNNPFESNHEPSPASVYEQSLVLGHRVRVEPLDEMPSNRDETIVLPVLDEVLPAIPVSTEGRFRLFLILGESLGITFKGIVGLALLNFLMIISLILGIVFISGFGDSGGGDNLNDLVAIIAVLVFSVSAVFAGSAGSYLFLEDMLRQGVKRRSVIRVFFDGFGIVFNKLGVILLVVLTMTGIHVVWIILAALVKDTFFGFMIFAFALAVTAFLTVRWSVFFPLTVIEDMGMESLKRSAELVRGHGLKIFGTMMAPFLVIMVEFFILALLFQSDKKIFQSFVVSAVFVVVTFLIYVWMVVLPYFAYRGLKSASNQR